MTHDGQLPAELRELGLDSDDLDGHTIEELADYLDAGRTPPDPSIEQSAGCQLALDAMERLRTVAGSLFDADVAAEPEPEETWVQSILSGIALDARAGRRIPVAHPSARADLGITEGAVRGIVRAAEADVPGAIVGRCRLHGDVTTPGEPVRVDADLSVPYGESVPALGSRLRAAIAARLAVHTELNVAAIDITIRDIHDLPDLRREERP